MNEKIIRRAKLWYCEGTSDKVYVAEVVQTHRGYEVRGHWGRRGRSLQSQTKGVYLSEWQAVSYYVSLVHEKTSKGYEVTERTGAAC